MSKLLSTRITKIRRSSVLNRFLHATAYPYNDSAYIMLQQFRLSVTRVDCIKTAEYIPIKIFSLSDRPIILVFHH